MRPSSPSIELTSFIKLGLCLSLIAVLTFPAFAKMSHPPKSFTTAVADFEAVELVEMPRMKNSELLAKAEREELEKPLGGPMIFAHPFEVEITPTTHGHWETLDDGSLLWRLRIASSQARHINLGFSRFDLPEGAGLWLYNRAGDYIEGPYNAADRSRRGRFFTPVVFGDEVVVELHLPSGTIDDVDLVLGRINHGFRGFEKRHGACNNDVVCPEGDPWRDQIRSVGFYTINGFGICSGQLVNNTAGDETPYFLSAFHCGIDELNADSLVFFWNHEAPVCGQQAGGSLQDNQSGSIFRAGEVTSDFLLLELEEPPAPEFNVHYSGWDASGVTPRGAVGIHHPQTDVKSISFNDDALAMSDIGFGVVSHWEVDNWEDGTTEGGSSGSCIWDPDTQLCVGVLTGGFASCEAIENDFYGKLSYAWDVGTSPETRLGDWLDPLGTGELTLGGRDPGSAGGCRPNDTTLCLRSNRFAVEVLRSGPDGPRPARVAANRSDESGFFWFFTAQNFEVLVKVLDGCDYNDHFWVYAAGATDVEWSLRVTDTESGAVREFTDPPNPLTDTRAFASCAQ